MLQQIEISKLDLRFEGHRLKNKEAEMKLLTSISENGIRDPLQGVESADMYVLLNGFKRYRCAKKLSISIVPYCNLVQGDTGTGIIELLRISNSKSLNILEQAKLIDELKSVYQMSTKDIADLLEKSKAWVSARTGIIKEISKNTMDKIMDGQFPIYAYMYILRSFIRMNKIRKEDIDEFVTLISGKDLSIRDIEILANGYFKGSEEIRNQIRDGNIKWSLKKLNQSISPDDDCTSIERRMLNDLGIIQKYMQRVSYSSGDKRFKNNSFFAQANLLSGGILRNMDIFQKSIKELHDRSRKA
ncbi:MAG: putative ParB-like family protein [Candidatus Magnetoglobus multicellularis str. Araruama]|uniref:Putative ParB-like family protein n=1 Tax=Candidatus Magnetoglobus multicellularis str. Araruama TaxID=890399 RepID=A0A1V1P3J8_9BACT|nr:MAG: putative ParB-like family protein [Candidatus Magnetoglobus multicellularis str. Araruama]